MFYPRTQLGTLIRIYARHLLQRHRFKHVFGCRAASDDAAGKLPYQLSYFPPDKIRNFCIVAHIDHGKSTLADRLLELTGVITVGDHNNQVLDKLQVERERGITVKAQTASLFYHRAQTDQMYLLNLIDTPGHVDFSYEVSRSVRACEGAILLVDCNKGVQAQTMANFHLAFANNLSLLPALNKIDLPNADPDGTASQMETLFEIDPTSCIQISAKLGTGVTSLLEAVVTHLPPPEGSRSNPMRALVFDCWYDRWKGAVIMVALKDGSLKVGDSVTFCHTSKVYEIKELGVLSPDEKPVKQLYAGQVGYLTCNMRSAKEAHIGDTIRHSSATDVPALPMLEPAKPMVYAGVYPMDQSEQPKLRMALEKLLLNDSSISLKIESSPALGHGWRLGFLGLLHMDVFTQRLQQEYGAEVVLTAPSVTFKAKIVGEKNIRNNGGSDIMSITNPCEFPEPSIVASMSEPIITGTIITPDDYLGAIMGLCVERRGVQIDCKNIDSRRVAMQFRLPLCEIVVDFYDNLKSISSGFASFDYENQVYEESQLVKIDFALNGTLVNELSLISHASKARTIAKSVCARLKETIPRQQIQIAIQAMLRGKIIAREDIKAYRKDVTAKLYGGDVTRKMKLLKQQSDGKKRMKMVANIQVPRETFVKVLQR